MKKILFVLSRIPWPSDTGMKSLYAYWCDILCKELKCEIYLFFPNREKNAFCDVPKNIKQYAFGKKISLLGKIKNLILHSLFGTWSLQEALYYSSKNAKLLKEYCNSVSPDIVVFDMIRLAKYVKCTKGFFNVINLNDLLSNRYEFQLKSKNKDSIFGQSNENGFFSRLTKNGFFRKLALKVERKKVYRSEVMCSLSFDKVVFVSEKERNIYNERSRLANGFTIPIGVDIDYFNLPQTSPVDNIMVFLGNYNYAPNYSSVIMICDNILPFLKSEYKMIFIGPCPEELSQRYSNENVVFTGMVEDTRTIVKDAKLFLAPIAYGTGIKTKIIEAMAMGKCVVTNDIGAENIDALNWKDIIIVDSISEIPNVVDELLPDSQKIMFIGNNAKQVATEKYNYDNVKNTLQSVLLKK